MSILKFDIKASLGNCNITLGNCNLTLWERFLISISNKSCIGIKSLTFSAIQTFFQLNFFPNTLWWQATLDGREPILEVNIWLKTTITGRQNLRKTCLLGRTTFNRRQPYIKEKNQQTNFNDWQLKLITAQFNILPWIPNLTAKKDQEKSWNRKLWAEIFVLVWKKSALIWPYWIIWNKLENEWSGLFCVGQLLLYELRKN